MDYCFLYPYLSKKKNTVRFRLDLGCHLWTGNSQQQAAGPGSEAGDELLNPNFFKKLLNPNTNPNTVALLLSVAHYSLHFYLHVVLSLF
jgi:hypothetical protein